MTDGPIFPQWKLIDSTARDGGLWPVADLSGSPGIAKFSDGAWRFLVHDIRGFPRFVACADPAQTPLMYFDIPAPPNFRAGIQLAETITRPTRDFTGVSG